MPLAHSLSEAEDVLTFQFHGVVTDQDIESYHELRINYPVLKRPVVVFIDSCEVKEWDFQLNLERMMGYTQQLAHRYSGTGEIIATVSAGATERFYGYVSALRSYVSEDYPVEALQTREEAEVCIQRYLKEGSSS